MSDKLGHVRDEIANRLDEIKRLFKPGTKLTLLVRHPSHTDGSRDLVMTDDAIDDAVAALLIRKEETKP